MKSIFKPKPRTPVELVRHARELLFYVLSDTETREHKREEKVQMFLPMEFFCNLSCRISNLFRICSLFTCRFRLWWWKLKDFFFHGEMNFSMIPCWGSLSSLLVITILSLVCNFLLRIEWLGGYCLELDQIYFFLKYLM